MGTFTTEERIRISEFVIDLFALVYDDGNGGDVHRYVTKWHLQAAKYCAKMSDKESAGQHLRLALKHAAAYETLDPGEYTALMVRGQKYNGGKGDESLKALLQKELAAPCFDEIREDKSWMR